MDNSTENAELGTENGVLIFIATPNTFLYITSMVLRTSAWVFFGSEIFFATDEHRWKKSRGQKSDARGQKINS